MELLKCIFILVTVLSLNYQYVSSANGGTNCLVCSALLGIMEQMSVIHNSNITEELKRVCDIFPPGFINQACIELVEAVGPAIDDLFDTEETSDLVCNALGFCYTDPGYPVCHLYPLPEGGMERIMKKESAALNEFRLRFGNKVQVCDLPGIKKICETYNLLADVEYLPLVDVDGDRFSVYETMRGFDWRGKDCNDLQASHYPGRRPEENDAYSDSNCNGIYGINQESGLTYEEEFCSGTNPFGVMILGDSAGANFHIPQEWLTPSMINSEVFSYLPYILSNTFNFPMSSGTTGFKNITAPIIQGTTDSLYWRLLERNRCNHRDYQNIAVNGGKSRNIYKISQSLARNQTNDYPLFITLAVIGNDVCTGDVFSLESMTTPEDFRAYILETLDYLDATVPAGSHLILSGLVDGRALYDNLYYRIHPVGELRQDVTYAHFYDTLNCLEMSPCPGWMSINETQRDLTSERAANLSKVMEEIAAGYTYNNFDMAYFDFPAQEVIAEWEEIHGPNTGWQLIEVVDGFHPSQRGQAAFAAKIWEMVERDRPDFLGDINPNNARIVELFGDQGGH